MPQLSPEESRLREIKELERELARKKAAMGIDRPADIPEYPDGKETARELSPKISEQPEEWVAERENAFKSAAAAVKNSAAASDKDADEQKKEDIIRDAKAIASMDEERKIQTLAALAWQRGISYSIDVAKKLEDPYTLDLLHSHLANELHDQLVAAKKLDDI